MSYLLYVAAFGEPRAHPRDLPSTPQNSRQVGPIGAPRTPRGSKVQRTAKTQTLDSCTPSPLIARRWTNVGAVNARRVLYTSRKTYARFTTRRVLYTMHTQDPPPQGPHGHPKTAKEATGSPKKAPKDPPRATNRPTRSPSSSTRGPREVPRTPKGLPREPRNPHRPSQKPSPRLRRLSGSAGTPKGQTINY